MIPNGVLDFQPFYIGLFGYRNEIAHVKHPIYKRVHKQLLRQRRLAGGRRIREIEAHTGRHEHFTHHKFQGIWVWIRFQIDPYVFRRHGNTYFAQKYTIAVKPTAAISSGRCRWFGNLFAQTALPFTHHCRGNAVAHHIGGAASHIQQRIDAQQ